VNRIRQLRLSQGMTQAQLARIAGCGRSFLSEIETGKANPTQAMLQTIADALHVPVARILDECSPNSGADDAP
jgi:transcriptional regulator with XRE-family HTH domain